jgi:hypothetical protein
MVRAENPKPGFGANAHSFATPEDLVSSRSVAFVHILAPGRWID